MLSKYFIFIFFITIINLNGLIPI